MNRCTAPLSCSNCKGEHYATSRVCTVWKTEKEVLRIKYTQSISFAEARKVVESWQPKKQGVSYASVASKPVEMIGREIQVNLCGCAPLSSISSKSQTVAIQTLSNEQSSPKKQAPPKSPSSEKNQQSPKSSRKSSPSPSKSSTTEPSSAETTQRSTPPSSEPSSPERRNKWNRPRERLDLSGRLKKAEKGPIPTSNRFADLRTDVELMEDEDMGLSPPRSPNSNKQFSPVKYP